MYVQPATIADLVDHTVMRVCDQLGIETDLAPRWAGLADWPRHLPIDEEGRA